MTELVKISCHLPLHHLTLKSCDILLTKTLTYACTTAPARLVVGSCMHTSTSVEAASKASVLPNVFHQYFNQPLNLFSSPSYLALHARVMGR